MDERRRWTNAAGLGEEAQHRVEAQVAALAQREYEADEGRRCNGECNDVRVFTFSESSLCSTFSYCFLNIICMYLHVDIRGF